MALGTVASNHITMLPFATARQLVIVSLVILDWSIPGMSSPASAPSSSVLSTGKWRKEKR